MGSSEGRLIRFWLATCSWRWSIASVCLCMLRTKTPAIIFWVIRIFFSSGKKYL
ncbi:MAG: hypothetical protein MUC46_04015 [Desulfobacterales bacterium]|nr:hypothetical protein [Desulfobacterales bacterium]